MNCLKYEVHHTVQTGQRIDRRLSIERGLEVIQSGMATDHATFTFFTVRTLDFSHV